MQRTMLGVVVDLEQELAKRDKMFVARLVLTLVLGAIFGLFVYAKLISAEIGACTAGAFGDITESGSEIDPSK